VTSYKKKYISMEVNHYEMPDLLPKSVVGLDERILQKQIKYINDNQHQNIIVEIGNQAEYREIFLAAARTIKNLYGLIISSEFFEIAEQQTDLRYLSIGSPQYAKIDISRLHKLEYLCAIEPVLVIGLTNSSLIRSLEITGKSTCLTEEDLAKFSNLENLNLDGSKFYTLEHLASKTLSRITLNRMPNLSHLAIRADVASSIVEIDIENCRNLSDIGCLRQARLLRSLAIKKSKKIMSLDFLPFCHSLEIFVFMESDIADKKISPILSVPTIKRVSVDCKKDFDMNKSELRMVANRSGIKLL
jgi:hypothetical protein